MNGMLLAGFTDQEAAAIEIMVGMNWSDWGCVTLRRGFTLGVPAQTSAAKACDLCIVDLFGFGMRKYSEDNEVRLLEFLNGRSAVLMVWGQGGGWLERELLVSTGQAIQWVTMPYTSAGMRDAVRKVLANEGRHPVRRTARVPSTDADKASVSPAKMRGDVAAPSEKPPEVAIPAWKRAMAMADEIKAQTKVRRPESTTMAAKAKGVAAAQIKCEQTTKPAEQIVKVKPSAWDESAASQRVKPQSIIDESLQGISTGAFDVLLAAFPALREAPIVQLAYRIATSEGMIGVRVGQNPIATLHMRQGWVRSGLPQSALFKMLHTPHLVESVILDSLDDGAAQVDSQTASGMGRIERSLDAVTWDVISEGLKSVSLEVSGDLMLQLRRFPNFTVLSEVSSLDVQLAAICARSSQRLSDLARAFPERRHEIMRFVILSVTSGAAHIRPVENLRASAQPTAPVPVQPPPPPSAAKRGLFKSLLNKLFN